jgi:hypothetical protein
MNQQDIYPIKTEPLKALVDRAHSSVIRIVIDRAKIQASLEPSMIDFLRRLRHEISADLGREHKILLRQAAQDSPKAVLGLALAVQWRSVKIANAGAALIR